MIRHLFLFILICTSILFAKEEDISTISESLGHLIRKNLDALGVNFDINLVIQGMKSNKQAPLTEDECMHAISLLQEDMAHEKAEINLKKANEFLSKNRDQKEVIELEPNKLQYKILKPGNGVIVKETDAPILTYTGRYLDESIFGCTENPEAISLEDTILGFKKAIIGMQEGEKRIIYIHPDLGYGKNNLVEPNSLLIFEVEVIQVNNTSAKLNPYICNSPEKINEAIR